MSYAIGILLAMGVAGFGRWSRFDRSRAFYPTLVIVVASYYVLFAVLGGSRHALVVESIGMAVFVTIALAAFQRSAWWAVAGLAAHGLFDGLHGFVVSNPGTPDWWPAFCSTFDVGAAGLLAFSLVLGGARTAMRPSDAGRASTR